MTTATLTKVLYTAEATVKGGRTGHATSSDGRLDVDLSAPSEMGGAGGSGTNPEQLFAAGYAACFQSALLGVAKARASTCPIRRSPAASASAPPATAASASRSSSRSTRRRCRPSRPGS
jgi:organic hydroperoxide reductase OsmC/OhrA